MFLQKMGCKKYVKGSYTVEASLLMVIIIGVLAAIISLDFYLHDLGYMYGAVHEAACGASLHADDEKQDRNVAQRLIAGRMLGTEGVSTRFSLGKKEVTVSYRGVSRILMIASPFFGKNQLNLESKVSLTIQRPTVLIQKLRGAVKIVNRVRGE